MPIQRITRLVSPEAAKEVADALGWSSFSKDPEKLAAKAGRFVTESDKAVYAEVREGRIIGIVALEQAGDTVTIASIGVDASCRGQGIGRSLVERAAASFPGARLVAETDRDAVEFYRKCGFGVVSLGLKHPGVERFLCTLPARVPPAVGFRDIGAADLPELAALYVEVFSAPPWRERRSLEEVLSSLRRTAGSPGFVGVAGLRDGAIVAAAWGNQGIEEEASRFDLREMLVHPRHQRQGLGTAILGRLEALLAARGVVSARLVTAADAPARAFYARCGYSEVPNRVMLEKRIESPRGPP